MTSAPNAARIMPHRAPRSSVRSSTRYGESIVHPLVDATGTHPEGPGGDRQRNALDPPTAAGR